MVRHYQWLAQGLAAKCIGTVGYVVHDRPECVSFHSIYASLLLLDLSADVLASETSDDRNDLINRVLPYAAMAFKVLQIAFQLIRDSHIL